MEKKFRIKEISIRIKEGTANRLSYRQSKKQDSVSMIMVKKSRHHL